MSELKAFVARKIDDGSCDPVPCIEVYSKSEADKVIAELEESNKKEVGQLLMEIVELKKQVHDYALGSYVIQARAEKEARHDKYKRCVAMAMWCNEKWLVHNFAEVPTKLGFYDKWQKRWLALAEEPTWAKFLTLIHKEAK